MSEAVQAGPSTPSSTPHAPPLGPSSPSTIRTRRASTQIPTTPRETTASAPASPTLRTSPRRAGKQREVEMDENGNGSGNASSSPRHAPSSGRLRADIPGEAGEGSASMPAPLPVTVEEDGPQFIQPDHFYPLNNGAKPSASTTRRWETVGQQVQPRWLSPEDDPLALRGIPVFKPTMEEFQDFEAYVTKTEPWGMRSGITKIIPPAEWVGSLPAMDRRTLSNVQIRNPIQQNMMGNGGVFRQTNIEKNKSRPLSVREWFEKCGQDKFAGPMPREIERGSKEAREMRAEMEREKKAAKEKKLAERARRRMERLKDEEARANAEAQVQTEGDPSADVEMGTAQDRDETQDEAEADVAALSDVVPALDPSSSGSSHSSPDPIATTPEPEQLDPWYVDTDLSSAWLPKNTRPEDYTPEACARLQDKFWKNMGLGEPSWYGADLMQGSLFADRKTPWNVANLPNLLNRIGTVVPGVNEPYLYFGMWRATFAWHVEDMDLFSINYIHFGAPKFWYAIPQGQAQLFERRLVDWFPTDARHCDQFLRHKACAISPTQLEKHGIRANMLVHNQGEFVITYPRGYHAGFNMGFNCAESVNFALESWIDLGRKAKYCQCVSHSVRINVDKMLLAAEDAVSQPPGAKTVKRQLFDENGGEEVPHKRRRKKDKPVLPAVQLINVDGRIDISAAGVKEDVDAVEGTITAIPVAVTPKKRGRPRKIKVDEVTHHADGAGAAQLEVKDKASRPRPRPSKPVRIVKEKPSYPCVFCPSLSTDNLLPVFEPNDQVRSASKATDGKILAHLACAQAIPEVWIAEEDWDGKRQEVVLGSGNVVKDRWNLKCICCADKSLATTGVKIQCTKGKCPKAFHVSCANDSEQVQYRLWQVDEQVPVTPPPDVPEGYQPTTRTVSFLRAEALCPQHNPAMVEIKERQKAEELKRKIMALVPGQNVKVKRPNGATFAMPLVRIAEEAGHIEVQTETGTMSVPWDKVDFRESKITLQENEYARDYVNKRRPSAPHPEATNQTANNPAASAPTAVVPSQVGQAGPSSAQHLGHPFRNSPSLQPASVSSPGSSGSSHGHARPAPGRGPVPQAQYAPVAPEAAVRALTYRQVIHPYTAAIIPSRVVLVDSCGADYERSSPHLGPPRGAVNGHQYPSPPFTAAPLQPYHLPHLHPPPAYHTPPTRHQVHHHPAPHLAPSPHYHTHPSHPCYAPPQTLPAHPYYPSDPVYDIRHHPSLAWHAPPPPLLPPRHRSAESQPRKIRLSESRSKSAQVAGAVSQSNGTGTGSGNGGSTPHSMSLSNLVSGPLPNGSPSGSGGAQSNGSGNGSGVGKIDLGLARMSALMQALSPTPIPAIHLAGTNGKGSVSALLESVLLASGLRVGRYNSPHLIEPRDAIRVDGIPPPREEYEWCKSRVINVSKTKGIEATTFEIATAAAYFLLGRAGVEVMIIECGMGGARDATNVLDPSMVLASGLTAVGLDHTAFLGDTIEAIAEEKAKIAVPGGLLVVAPQPYHQASSVAAQVAGSRGATVIQAPRSTVLESSKGPASIRPWSPPQPAVISTPLGPEHAIVTRLNLPGEHQVDNLSLALAILQGIRTDPRAGKILPRLAQISDEAIRQGVERTRWAGRCSWEIYGSSSPGGARCVPVLVDGAHNADSATTLRNYLDSLGDVAVAVRWIISLSDSKGKSVESVLAPLLRRGDEVVAMEFGTPVEGMPWVQPVAAEEIARVARRLVGSASASEGGKEEAEAEVGRLVSIVKGRGSEGVKEALNARRTGEKLEKLDVLCGSLYLVADFYRLLSAR